MRDGDIRRALHARLKIEHYGDADTLMVDELSVCGMARVDVAVVNGTFSAFELKSELDKLTRLPVQAEWYSKVVDHATLVVADRHLAHAEAIVPAWWGVMVATGGEDVDLAVQRPSGLNPGVDPYSLVRLMWRDETLAALEERDLADGLRSKPKARLWEALADALPIDELRLVVRQSLKAREGWRVGTAPTPGGGGSPGAATSRSSRSGRR